MKRWTCAVCVAVLLLVLAGCGGASASNTDTDGMPGGYSDDRDLNQADRALFDRMTGTLAGVDYEPLKVATQVVAGTNYRFYARATQANGELYPEESYVYIYVFVPLEEGQKPKVTEIVEAR